MIWKKEKKGGSEVEGLRDGIISEWMNEWYFFNIALYLPLLIFVKPESKISHPPHF